MLIPLDTPVALPVTAVVLAPEPRVSAGQLVRLEADRFVLRLDAPVARGARVVVSLGEGGQLAGRALAEDPTGTVVSRELSRPPDDRAGPRVRLRALLRWAPCGPDAAAWLAGGPDPTAFRAIRGPVELSVSGLRAPLGPPPPPVGARLLTELVPARTGPVVRAVAVVRRVDGPSGKPSAGLQFDEVPDPAGDALAALVLRHL